MKLSFCWDEASSPLYLSDEKPQVLVIENQTQFCQLIREIKDMESGEAECQFYSGIKPLSFQKEIELILNPFDISCNSKRIQQALYHLLSETAVNETHYLRTANLLSAAQEVLYGLSEDLPYPIEYDETTVFSSVLKAFNIKLSVEDGSLLENLIDYLKIVSAFCHKRVFVLMNLRMMLTQSELMELYKFANYQKIYMLLIEAASTYELNSEIESFVILDHDFCEIRGG